MPPTIKQPETKYLAEYLATKVSGARYIQRVPLGSVMIGDVAAGNMANAIGLARPFRPEADALIIYSDHVVLVEAKIFKLVDGLAKLPLYKSLFPHTPELLAVRNLPVTMRLLTPWSSSNLEIMAKEAGVEIDVFTTPWMDMVVADYQNYWSLEHRQKRANRKALLERFGME